MARRGGPATRGDSRAGGGTGIINVRVDVYPPISQVISRYQHLATELRDWRPTWDRMIPQLRREMGRIFMSQGSTTAGGKWGPWSKGYKKRRPNGAIMVLSGKLLNKLTTRGVLTRNKRMLRFGVRHPGARALNFGSFKLNLKRRMFIDSTDAIKTIAFREMNRHARYVIRAAMRR